MLSPRQRDIITRTCRKYGTSRVLLFGSAISEETPRDVDIAVDGVHPATFFKLQGELIRLLNCPVDLVDLSVPSSFTALIIEEGVPLL